MIIDTHTHLFGENLTPRFWEGAMANFGGAVSGRPVETVRERMKKDWYDESGDLLVADMDEAGIDKSVFFVMDLGLYAGTEDGMSLADRYRIGARAVKRHPDRLMMFGGIDPRRPDAAQFIEHAAGEWNIKGIKIWPPTGIAPDDPTCYRVYEMCGKLKLPVTIHTGHEIAPFRSDTTRPMYCDRPANDYPEVTFILAHAGMAWWEEAAQIAAFHTNVYLDTAYWQEKYLKHPPHFYREFRGLLSMAGKTKVVFGSDWPALRMVRKVAPKIWIETVKSLPENSTADAAFSEEEVRLYLGENAARILALSDGAG